MLGLGMIKGMVIKILFFWITGLFAQDEYLMRRLLVGEKKDVKAELPVFNSKSSRYQFDFNQDGYKEFFFLSKVDGQDRFSIENFRGEEIFRYAFETKGLFSYAYQLQARRLSKDYQVFLIHFFEGKTLLQGTARLYFLTVDNGRLSTLSMKMGPYLWEEFDNKRGHYRQRAKKLSLFDLDKDGVREVIVKHHLLPVVYKYKGNGKWVDLLGKPL